jgi:hypothetical protein
MAFYCLTMLSMALELAQENPVYEDMRRSSSNTSSASRTRSITSAGTVSGNEEDGFYYDQLKLDGQMIPLRTRSLVADAAHRRGSSGSRSRSISCPDFAKRMKWFLEHRPDLARASLSRTRARITSTASWRSHRAKRLERNAALHAR